MNDLLKREKVLRTIQKMFECCTTYDIIDYRDLMTEAIKVLPPERQINLNRPRGEWIVHFDDLFPEESSIECSVCHEEQPLEIDDNYCPHCGARMKGADDE